MQSTITIFNDGAEVMYNVNLTFRNGDIDFAKTYFWIQIFEEGIYILREKHSHNIFNELADNIQNGKECFLRCDDRKTGFKFVDDNGKYIMKIFGEVVQRVREDDFFMVEALNGQTEFELNDEMRTEISNGFQKFGELVNQLPRHIYCDKFTPEEILSTSHLLNQNVSFPDKFMIKDNETELKDSVAAVEKLSEVLIDTLKMQNKLQNIFRSLFRPFVNYFRDNDIQAFRSICENLEVSNLVSHVVKLDKEVLRQIIRDNREIFNEFQDEYSRLVLS